MKGMERTSVGPPVRPLLQSFHLAAVDIDHEARQPLCPKIGWDRSEFGCTLGLYGCRVHVGIGPHLVVWRPLLGAGSPANQYGASLCRGGGDEALQASPVEGPSSTVPPVPYGVVSVLTIQSSEDWWSQY